MATDNHIGYAEKDRIRGNDSLVTFEEILSHAQELKADFILLGGDLFHENKPSRYTLHTCMKLLRNYCFGDNPVQFEFLSDPVENFKHSSSTTVNYEDPNINVSLPVFSIHGNHDDPAGLGQLAALDMLSVTGLINYFGKSSDLDSIDVAPLLLKKGNTRLALYGLGAIRDERLHRMFNDQKVKFLRPQEYQDDWFNLFVLHQNRASHGPTQHIPEQFLPNFLNLVIWGHEHECKIVPESGAKPFYNSQPGSSVATSLSAGEAVPKHVGLLEICGEDMRMTKIPLETVRQFYMEDIILCETSLDLSDNNISNKVMQYCAAKIDELLERAAEEHTGHNKQPKQPLIRLRVEYEDHNETFIQSQLGVKYVNKVANPDDMILFRRRRQDTKKKIGGAASMEQIEFRMNLLDISHFSALDLVKEHFEKSNPEKKMVLLSEKGVGAAIMEFVDKEEKEAINELVNYQLEKTQSYLMTQEVDEDTVEEEVVKYKDEIKTSGQEDDDMEKVIQAARRKAGSTDQISDQEMVVSDISDENEDTSPQRGRGRGRGRGQTRATGRGSRGTRAKASGTTRAPRASRGRGRGSRSSTASTSSILPFTRRPAESDRSDENTTASSSTKRPRRSVAGSSQNKKGVVFDDSSDSF